MLGAAVLYKRAQGSRNTGPAHCPSRPQPSPAALPSLLPPCSRRGEPLRTPCVRRTTACHVAARCLGAGLAARPLPQASGAWLRRPGAPWEVPCCLGLRHLTPLVKTALSTAGPRAALVSRIGFTSCDVTLCHRPDRGEGAAWGQLPRRHACSQGASCVRACGSRAERFALRASVLRCSV